MALALQLTRNFTRKLCPQAALRWTATGLLEAERKFRKVKGFRDLANLHHKPPSLTQQSQVA